MKSLAISLCFLLLALVSATSKAEINYICLSEGEERKISVVYTYPDSPVPCEVTYEKYGQTQSLWRAQSEVGYCELQAEIFVDKQRGWGWDCEQLTLTPITSDDSLVAPQ